MQDLKRGFFFEVVGDPSSGSLGAMPPDADEIQYLMF